MTHVTRPKGRPLLEVGLLLLLLASVTCLEAGGEPETKMTDRGEAEQVSCTPNACMIQ